MGRYTRKEMADYLIREQGYDEIEVSRMDEYEMYDLYQMYHGN